jgi:hypothetical protein
MKKLLAVLILFSLPLAPVRAQGLNGKILIVRDSIYQDAHRLESLLPTIYSGIVDSMSIYPNDLSGYDAIIIFAGSEYRYPFDTISISDQLRLIDYLNNGGRIYSENGSSFTIDSPLNDTTPDPEDTLWHYIGLQGEGEDQIYDYYDTIVGVDSEFTRGIRVLEGFEGASDPGTYYPAGNIVPVLLAPEEEFPEYDALAWISSNPSIRAVMHHPITALVDYYNVFLTRVLCDYFGLCVDAVREAPPSEPAIALRVVI